MYFVYLLRCADGSIYTGITTDVARRLAEHKAGSASRYTRARGARKILWSERHKNRSTATKREAQIKKLSRKAKLGLIKQTKPLTTQKSLKRKKSVV